MEKMAAEAYSNFNAVPTSDDELRSQKIGVDIMKQKIHYSRPDGPKPEASDVAELKRLISQALKRERDTNLFSGPTADARKMVRNAGGRVNCWVMNDLLCPGKFIHCTYVI
jgi:hypothetical protein